MACPSSSSLAAWRAGTLPADERAALEAHVASCEACAELTGAPSGEADAGAQRPGPAPTIRPGQRIGRYLVLWELGRGGMGAVYAAFDSQLDRKVALKLLLPGADRAQGSDAELAQARLLREAQALARVSNPHTVAVFDVGTHEGQVFMAMEHLDGVGLKRWSTEKPRGWREVVAMVSQAGEGLAAAHAAGLVHRDFKPANVIVTTGGQAKVFDFGLVRLASRADGAPESHGSGEVTSEEPISDSLGEALTAAGSLCGTPGYVAPELLAGGSPTPLSDQFAFGVTLYQCLYGSLPFGRAARARDVAVIEGAYPEGPVEASDTPPWLDAVVRRCLSPNPAARYPDLGAVLVALGKDPALARRRVAQRAAVTGLVGFALAATWLAGRGPACPTEPELREQLLPASRRVALQEKLRNPRRTTVFADLDSAVAAWASESAAACREGEQDPPPPLALQRRGCLERRGLALSTLVDGLIGLDASLTRKAGELVDTLLRDVSCSSPAGYSGRSSEEVPASQRGLARSLRAGLLKVKGLASIGREAEALALARVTAAQAADAGLVGFEGEALSLIADQEYVQGDSDKALRDYEAAFRRLLEAGIDGQAILVGVDILHSQVDRADTLPTSRVVLQVCEALWARNGRNPNIELSLLSGQAAVASAEGDVDRFVALAERRVLLSSQLYGVSARETALARAGLGSALWSKGDISRSNREDEAALTILIDQNGPDDPTLVGMYLSLGMGLRHEGRRGEALAKLERGRALAASLGDHTNSLGADLEVELAEQLLGTETGRALELSQGAVAFYEGRANRLDLSSALAVRAAALAALGRGTEALADCARAKALHEGLADDDDQLKVSILVCEADALASKGDAAGSLARHEALSLLTPSKLPGERGEYHFAHARALRAAHGDAARVTALARQALADYSAFPGFGVERAAIEDFLAGAK